MIRTYEDLSFRYMMQQKKRSVLNIIGVLMSAVLISGTGTIMESLQKQMIGNAVAKDGNYHVCFTNVNREQAEIINNHLAVKKSFFEKIGGFATLAETGNNDSPFFLLQINEYDSMAMDMLGKKESLISGHLPLKPGEIAVDTHIMKILGSNYGLESEISLQKGLRRKKDDDSVITSFSYPLYDENRTRIGEYFQKEEIRNFTISGTIAPDYYLSDNYSFNALTYQDLSIPVDGELLNCYALLTHQKNIYNSAVLIAEDLGLETSQIKYNNRLLNVLGESVDKRLKNTMDVFTVIIMTIIIVATIAVIYNSFNISLIERISQLGVMRCVGASPFQIGKLILREAGLICMIAIPPGIAIGVTAMKIVFYIADTFSSNILFEGIQLVISFKVILYSLVLCTATVLLSALFPALKAGSVSAIEAVRSTGMFSHDRSENIPFIKKRRVHKNIAFIMALRNIGRNRKRFLVILFSMVISVVLYISFGGMLQLLKDSYIIKDENIPGIKLESTFFIEEDIYNKIKSFGSVDFIVKYGSAEVSLIVDEEKLSPNYRKYVQNLSNFEKTGNKLIIPGSRIICYGNDIFARLTKESEQNNTKDVVLVRKALFRDDGGTKAFGPNTFYLEGDYISIFGENVVTPLSIAAVTDEVLLENFNESEGAIDIIVNEKTYKELTGEKDFKELFIRLNGKETKTGLIEFLEDITDRNLEYSYIDAQAQALEMIRETQVLSLFFYGFIVVIAFISTLNIINTISTNLLIRTREFGMLQAVGLDHYSLRKMILWESVIYSGISLVIGSLIGTGIWYLMVSNMNEVRITLFQVPFREIIISAMGLGIITLMSGYFPLKRILKKPIIENIRMEE